jgi:hypothetical protein
MIVTAGISTIWAIARTIEAIMTYPAESSFTITHDGVPFAVDIFRDSHSPEPWEMSDGHGPVRTAPRAEKRPGERVLGPTGSRDWWYLYDFRAAVVTALKDGWRPVKQRAGIQTRRTLASDAVNEDYEYLRAWVQDEWHYVGVVVTHEESGANYSTWGVESNDTAYLETVAHEQAAECMAFPEYLDCVRLQAARLQAVYVAARLREYADGVERMRKRLGDTAMRNPFPKHLREAAALLVTLSEGQS